MATVSLAQSQSLIQFRSWDPLRWRGSIRKVVRGLGRLLQQGSGLALLLLGGAMLFTLWLIPVGLLSTLLGLALVSERSR